MSGGVADAVEARMLATLSWKSVAKSSAESFDECCFGGCNIEFTARITPVGFCQNYRSLTTRMMCTLTEIVVVDVQLDDAMLPVTHLYAAGGISLRVYVSLAWCHHTHCRTNELMNVY